VNTVIIIVVVHGVISIIKLFEWTRFDSVDIDAFVYSFALYSVINSTVPGRLARIAVDKERKKMVQTKRALIRYLSHEVRSPLNVIHSGLNLLVTDLESLPAIEEKENLMETFTSIQHASGDLLETMNDLLLLESMDSAAFSIQEKMVPCANLTQIAEQCGVLPRAKGIAFAVSNQFDVLDEPSPPPLIAVELADQSTPLRDIELGLEPKVPESEQLLFIDEHKIGQVLRNLITNSAKFTPPGESIAVNIRQATPVDLTEVVNLTDDESEASINRKARTKKFSDENGYSPCGSVMIEVTDTGAGIAPEHRAKVFGQFIQFDAHKLQVMRQLFSRILNVIL
jgi:signal transduction histidine kinase